MEDREPIPKPLDEEVSKVYDSFAVRQSQAACIVESLQMLTEMTRVFDSVTVHKTRYGDAATGTRTLVWNVEFLISEFARDDEGGA